MEEVRYSVEQYKIYNNFPSQIKSKHLQMEERTSTQRLNPIQLKIRDQKSHKQCQQKLYIYQERLKEIQFHNKLFVENQSKQKRMKNNYLDRLGKQKKINQQLGIMLLITKAQLKRINAQRIQFQQNDKKLKQNNILYSKQIQNLDNQKRALEQIIKKQTQQINVQKQTILIMETQYKQKQENLLQQMNKTHKQNIKKLKNHLQKFKTESGTKIVTLRILFQNQTAQKQQIQQKFQKLTNQFQNLHNEYIEKTQGLKQQLKKIKSLFNNNQKQWLAQKNQLNNNLNKIQILYNQQHSNYTYYTNDFNTKKINLQKKISLLQKQNQDYLLQYKNSIYQNQNLKRKIKQLLEQQQQFKKKKYQLFNRIQIFQTHIQELKFTNKQLKNNFQKLAQEAHENKIKKSRIQVQRDKIEKQAKNNLLELNMLNEKIQFINEKMNQKQKQKQKIFIDYESLKHKVRLLEDQLKEKQLIIKKQKNQIVIARDQAQNLLKLLDKQRQKNKNSYQICLKQNTIIQFEDQEKLQSIIRDQNHYLLFLQNQLKSFIIFYKEKIKEIDYWKLYYCSQGIEFLKNALNILRKQNFFFKVNQVKVGVQAQNLRNQLITLKKLLQIKEKQNQQLNKLLQEKINQIADINLWIFNFKVQQINSLYRIKTLQYQKQELERIKYPYFEQIDDILYGVIRQLKPDDDQYVNGSS